MRYPSTDVAVGCQLIMPSFQNIVTEAQLLDRVEYVKPLKPPRP
jgi:hypothetical protein